MPETPEAIRGLADTMITRFTPPSFVPGCEVQSIADIDEYATNNGWIEAIVGGDNQQRVRYYGTPQGVAVNDFVDVEYFPAYKLYRVFGSTLGGTAAVGGLRVSEIWESDFDAVALQSNTIGNVGIGVAPTERLTLQSAAGATTVLGMYTGDGDGGDNNTITLYGVGTSGSITTAERLLMGWRVSDTAYKIFTQKLGSGTLRPLILEAGSTNQIYLDTNLGVAFNDTSTEITVEGITRNCFFLVNRADLGNKRGAAFLAKSNAASRNAQNTFLRANASGGAVADGYRVGDFFAEGHDGTDYNRSGRFGFVVDGAVSANTVPMAIDFSTSATNSGGLVQALRIAPDQDVIIGPGTTISARLHVDQDDTSGAQPALLLDQADLSEEFVNFVATVGAGNPIDTAAIGTYYGKIRVAVNGTFKYMALYNS